MKRPTYLSLPGAGPAITWEAGAVACVDEHMDVRGYSGSSAGALIAALKAFGIGDSSIRDLIKSMLRDGRMLDFGVDYRMGLLQWGEIPRLCDKVLGSAAKMGDAVKPLVVCVSDLQAGFPLYLSKKHTPEVLVREALAATASFLPGMLTPKVRIPSLGTELSPDVRPCGDGGWSDNTCDAVWDDSKHPRTAIRFDEPTPDRIDEWDMASTIAAPIRCALGAANRLKSVRGDGQVVWLPRKGGWDFQKPDSQCDSEIDEGYKAALNQLTTEEE